MTIGEYSFWRMRTLTTGTLDGLAKPGTASQVNNLTEGVRAELTRPHPTQP
jgi:hypothetical protein